MTQVLSYRDFTARMKKSQIGNFLFYGEEAYTKVHSLKKLRSTVLSNENDTFNHIKIDACDEIEADIDNAIEALPVFADRKLVELHGFDIAHMKAREYDAFLSHFDLLANNPETCLVLVTTPFEFDPGTAKKPSKQFSDLTKFLTPVEFSHESRTSLEKWICAHFSAEHINVHSTYASMLIDRVGADMFVLSGEIEKLCAYLRENKKDVLTKADIETVCCRNTVFDTFDLSNAVGDGDRAKALAIIKDAEKRGEAPEKLLSQISGVFCDFMKLRVLFDAGESSKSASLALKMNEYRTKLYYSKLAKLSFEKIARGIKLCNEADVKIKCTGLDKYVVLSRLITEVL